MRKIVKARSEFAKFIVHQSLLSVPKWECSDVERSACSYICTCSINTALCLSYSEAVFRLRSNSSKAFLSKVLSSWIEFRFSIKFSTTDFYIDVVGNKKLISLLGLSPFLIVMNRPEFIRETCSKNIHRDISSLGGPFKRYGRHVVNTDNS